MNKANLLNKATPAALAAATTYPLRERVNHTGIFRHLAAVDILPPAAIPIHPGHHTLPVVVMLPSKLPSVVVAQNVFIPTFEISSNVPTSFDVAAIDRAQDRLEEEITADEDAVGLLALDAAASECNNRFVGPLSRDVLSDAYAEVEKHNFNIASIVLGQQDYKAMEACMGDQFNKAPLRHSETHPRTAAVVWGADVIVSPMVLKGIYVVTESEHLAIMPVKEELTILVQRHRFMAFEEIGVCVHNTHGVAVINVAQESRRDWEVSTKAKMDNNLRSIFG